MIDDYNGFSVALHVFQPFFTVPSKKLATAIDKVNTSKYCEILLVYFFVRL